MPLACAPGARIAPHERMRCAAPAARPVYCPARDGATPRRRRGVYETRRRRPSLSCRKLRFSSATLPRCRAVVQSTFAYSPSDRSVACVKRLSMMSDPTRPDPPRERAERRAQPARAAAKRCSVDGS
ncbi:hypothetical protein AQ857_25905 [Burkholderia pseudomallei]|nr:hypothetical protein AQ858_07530 [Burkholderia pseudomallei]OMZ18431.1 hypothetical protein AQ857_25905 [Burkholderia pseudomallei]